MPVNDIYIYRRRKRSKAGRELDLAYKRHEIGYTHYWKIWDKPKYWEWK